MATVGWAAAAIGFLTAVFTLLRHFFEQIPPLGKAAIKAIETMREVRQALSGRPAKAPSPADEPEEQQSP